MEMNLENEEIRKCEESESCCKYSELKSKCLELEGEMEKNRSVCESLEDKLQEMEAVKVAMENELKELKMKNGEKTRVLDFTEGGEDEMEDPVIQLMIENKVLECEKRRAENEVEILKQKLKELESRVLEKEIHGGGSEGLEEVKNETPYFGTPPKDITQIEQVKGSTYVQSETQDSRQVRKQLTFREDTSPSKKMAPPTPNGTKTASLSVIDISDSDNENELVDENLDGIRNIPVLKRKRGSNIVSSDTESSEDDDNVPIGKLKRMCLKGSTSNVKAPRPKRLVSLRKYEETKKANNQQGIPTTEDIQDNDESEETGSESEGESLNGFIVKSSEESDTGDGLNGFIVKSSEDSDTGDGDGDGDGDGSNEDKDSSGDDVDFDEILSSFKRSRDEKVEWEFEADMLADFGKDPELCMRAVCALYRQQTSEEKVSKGTLVQNNRGFNKIDAHRGTVLAEFLRVGNPQGDLTRSVKELHKYDRKAVEKCRTLATRYSKQLFEIYKNKEDPLFLPSRQLCPLTDF